MEAHRAAVSLFAVASIAGSLPLAAFATHAPTVGQQREAVLFWSQTARNARFRHMYERFPSDVVVHGSHVHVLPAGKPLRIGGEDGVAWLAAYMTKYHIAGVMVLQDGRVRLRRFALGFGPGERWASFSIAKSVTSVLLGIALQQGAIHSLEDKLDTYIPELRGTAYADVSVRELLTMTSGVRWNEDYADPHSDVARMYQGACVDHEAQALAYLRRLPRAWPPGAHWNYDTGEIDLLGTLVQRATHRSLADFLAQTIWKPYGMASDAYWIEDGCDPGEDTGGSGLSATLADYARFGQFMLDGGRIDDRTVIAKAWLTGALHRQEHTDEPGHGYGYLWWTDADGSYAAIGIFGQMVYIDPARQLVIAQLASWPRATSDGLVDGRRAFVAAIRRAVDTDPESLPVNSARSK